MDIIKIHYKNFKRISKKTLSLKVPERLGMEDTYLHSIKVYVTNLQWSSCQKGRKTQSTTTKVRKKIRMLNLPMPVHTVPGVS